MITSTVSTYPGKKVVKHLGIVSAYEDAIRPFRLNVELASYADHAVAQLAKEAEALGANAVLGINFVLAERTRPIVIETTVILENE